MNKKLKATLITAFIILMLSLIAYGIVVYPFVVGGAVTAFGAGAFVMSIWYIVYENL